ncbi:hypothetical protein [Pedobacter sandarakinus]|uniref:hypothetical protein n=1 Tax=Pedobacter sandarakinus TaxID=353156 RepID=UPI002247A8E1|nr:hypothetical protein [Pedobacter sandarakinus]MCX2574244.1 hypothetical protein [Pedobacter sandarakinus]
MLQFILNKKFTLAFEALENKLRLVLFEGDEELVCRIEKLKNLQHFLAEDQTHLFKGRLQLSKRGGVIEVLVKQKSVGISSSSTFREILQASNT